MKQVLLSIGSMALILSLCLLNYGYMQNMTEFMTKNITDALEAGSSEDYELAGRLLDEAADRFEEDVLLVSLTINNRLLAEIEDSFLIARFYVTEGERTDAIIAMKSLLLRAQSLVWDIRGYAKAAP